MVYHYDLQDHLIAETSGSGNPIRTYVWRDDTPLAQIEYTPSRKILYYDVDHLNTPRAARDEAAKVVWRWESDAFGSTYPNEDPDGDGVKVTVNLRFPGQYYDQETGLHQNYFRDYEPSTGRYIQSDLIGLDGRSFSTFSYVGGNPLSLTDPYGLTPRGTTNGAAIGATVVAAGSIVVDAATGGINIAATPAEIAAGAAIGGAIGNFMSNMMSGGASSTSTTSSSSQNPGATTSANTKADCYAVYLEQIEVCKLTTKTARAREACYSRAINLYAECSAKCKK